MQHSIREYRLYWVPFMLDVANKPFMLNVIMLNVALMSIVILSAEFLSGYAFYTVGSKW